MLLATAGLRMVSPDRAELVLDACREELLQSGLLFRQDWASVVSGQEEGLYAWIAANYASGALQTVRLFAPGNLGCANACCSSKARVRRASLCARPLLLHRRVPEKEQACGALVTSLCSVLWTRAQHWAFQSACETAKTRMPLLDKI